MVRARARMGQMVRVRAQMVRARAPRWCACAVARGDAISLGVLGPGFSSQQAALPYHFQLRDFSAICQGVRWPSALLSHLVAGLETPRRVFKADGGARGSTWSVPEDCPRRGEKVQASP